MKLVTDDPRGNLNDILTARAMAESLHTAYPGHFWAVSCDGRTGFADVRNLALSGNWGFRIKLGRIYSASQFKKDVLKAGGEILERYHLSRGKASDAEIGDLKMDFAGRVLGDMA
ncbi:hypothetical protein [Acidithiobacillus sp.]|uniref:hypothetical protein n=1 Tax=Acidithiobacillus sp. TaxID=1872118 RepID=UPI0025909CAF|nr:hypothetical protein [Acidithiobacillus sp.]MDD5375287.1 hypothetical protein [Acidithiobacillus sp.]